VQGLSRRQTVDAAVSGVVVAILGALALGVALAPGRSRAEVPDTPAAPVPRVRIDAPGDEAHLRIRYVDHVFLLSDERHVPGARDVRENPQPTLVAGGPDLVTVVACCSIGDAPATIALRSGRPPAPVWRETAETDLDLPSGRLALSGTDGLLAVAELPSGAYRLRVAGRDAEELHQRRERFLIELWRRG
jgi:hypothetical protein